MTMQVIDIIDKYINSDSRTRQAIEKEVRQSETTLGLLLGFMDTWNSYKKRDDFYEVAI